MGDFNEKPFSKTSLYQRCTLKCVTVGDVLVGKTSMLSSYAHGSFPQEHVPTVLENYTAVVNYGRRPMTLGLIDTAGDESLHQTGLLAYPCADVFLVCFAVNAPLSMKNVEQHWVPQIRHNVGPNAKIILVGTKIDLRDNRDEVRKLKAKALKPVTSEEGRRLARKLKLSRYVECSALTGRGLSHVFEEAVSECMNGSGSPEANQRLGRKLVKFFGGIWPAN